jgi:hypothetical protein
MRLISSLRIGKGRKEGEEFEMKRERDQGKGKKVQKTRHRVNYVGVALVLIAEKAECTYPCGPFLFVRHDGKDTKNVLSFGPVASEVNLAVRRRRSCWASQKIKTERQERKEKERSQISISIQLRSANSNFLEGPP